MSLVNLAVVVAIVVLLRVIRGRGILPIHDQADLLTLFVAAWVALTICAVVACPGTEGIPGEKGPGDAFARDLAEMLGVGQKWKACDTHHHEDVVTCQQSIVRRLQLEKVLCIATAPWPCDPGDEESIERYSRWRAELCGFSNEWKVCDLYADARDRHICRAPVLVRIGKACYE